MFGDYYWMIMPPNEVLFSFIIAYRAELMMLAFCAIVGIGVNVGLSRSQFPQRDRRLVAMAITAAAFVILASVYYTTGAQILSFMYSFIAILIVAALSLITYNFVYKSNLPKGLKNVLTIALMIVIAGFAGFIGQPPISILLLGVAGYLIYSGFKSKGLINRQDLEQAYLNLSGAPDEAERFANQAVELDDDISGDLGEVEKELKDLTGEKVDLTKPKEADEKVNKIVFGDDKKKAVFLAFFGKEFMVSNIIHLLSKYHLNIVSKIKENEDFKALLKIQTSTAEWINEYDPDVVFIPELKAVVGDELFISLKDSYTKLASLVNELDINRFMSDKEFSLIDYVKKVYDLIMELSNYLIARKSIQEPVQELKKDELNKSYIKSQTTMMKALDLLTDIYNRYNKLATTTGKITAEGAPEPPKPTEPAAWSLPEAEEEAEGLEGGLLELKNEIIGSGEITKGLRNNFIKQIKDAGDHIGLLVMLFCKTLGTNPELIRKGKTDYYLFYEYPKKSEDKVNAIESIFKGYKAREVLIEGRKVFLRYQEILGGGAFFLKTTFKDEIKKYLLVGLVEDEDYRFVKAGDEWQLYIMHSRRAVPAEKEEVRNFDIPIIKWSAAGRCGHASIRMILKKHWDKIKEQISTFNDFKSSDDYLKAILPPSLKNGVAGYNSEELGIIYLLWFILKQPEGKFKAFLDKIGSGEHKYTYDSNPITIINDGWLQAWAIKLFLNYFGFEFKLEDDISTLDKDLIKKVKKYDVLVLQSISTNDETGPLTSDVLMQKIAEQALSIHFAVINRIMKDKTGNHYFECSDPSGKLINYYNGQIWPFKLGKLTENVKAFWGLSGTPSAEPAKPIEPYTKADLQKRMSDYISVDITLSDLIDGSIREGYQTKERVISGITKLLIYCFKLIGKEKIKKLTVKNLKLGYANKCEVDYNKKNEMIVLKLNKNALNNLINWFPESLTGEDEYLAGKVIMPDYMEKLVELLYMLWMVKSMPDTEGIKLKKMKDPINVLFNKIAMGFASEYVHQRKKASAYDYTLPEIPTVRQLVRAYLENKNIEEEAEKIKTYLEKVVDNINSEKNFTKVVDKLNENLNFLFGKKSLSFTEKGGFSLIKPLLSKDTTQSYSYAGVGGKSHVCKYNIKAKKTGITNDKFTKAIKEIGGFIKDMKTADVTEANEELAEWLKKQRDLNKFEIKITEIKEAQK